MGKSPPEVKDLCLKDFAQFCNKTQELFLALYHFYLLLLPESPNCNQFSIRMRDVFLHATFYKGNRNLKNTF